MEATALYELLKTVNPNVAYDHFLDTTESPAPQPPFILYRSPDDNNFYADDTNFYKEYNYIVDLITDKKDFVLEKQLEQKFKDNNITFDRYEDYIETERIFQIRYFI